MQLPSVRRASGGTQSRTPSWFLAQLLAIAAAVIIPSLASVSTAPSAAAADELPALPPGVVNDCPADTIFYLWKYNDSATVGVDKGCSTVNDVTRAQDPDLIANKLHVSCSDTISADGVPTKSDLGSPTRRVVAYVIQKKDGKVCGRGNPAEDPKTDISIVKTASKTTVTSGEEITYTLTVKNVGNTTAHNVLASDVLPDGVTFVSASAGCTYNSTNRTVTCDAGDLPASSSPTGSCTGKAIYFKWEYNDSATVGIDEGCSTVNDVTRAIKPDLIANKLHVSCSDTISADGVPTKSDLGDPARRVKAYFIRKPDGKTCGMGTFTPPGPKQFTIKVTVTKSHCNTATVKSDEPDTDPSNNTSTVCVNIPGFGYIEICKSSANGVTGTFAFVVEGVTYKVPAGACTSAIKVSSGNVKVTERFVLGFSMASATTSPADRLVSVDNATRTIVVKVVPGGISTQTVVHVVNKPVVGTLKVCQVAGAGVEEGTMFSFTNSVTAKTISVPAGPAPGGYCVIFGSFSGKVTVTQTAKTGYAVGAITVEPVERLITKNLTARTAQVQMAGGVTEVTYTNNKTGS